VIFEAIINFEPSFIGKISQISAKWLETVKQMDTRKLRLTWKNGKEDYQVN